MDFIPIDYVMCPRCRSLRLVTKSDGIHCMDCWWHRGDFSVKGEPVTTRREYERKKP